VVLNLGYAVSTLLSGLIVANMGSVRLFLVWGCVGVVTTLLHMVYVKCVPPIRGTYPLYFSVIFLLY